MDALGVGGVLHRAVNSNTNRGIVVINNVIVTVGSAALSVTTISVYPICSTHFHEELITLINIEQHHDHSSFIERNVTSLAYDPAFTNALSILFFVFPSH